MNTNLKQLIAVCALALVGTTAFAEDNNQAVYGPGTLTRAAVIADLQQARASGELVRLNRNYSDFGSTAITADVASGTVMVRNPADVRAEAVAITRARQFDSENHS
jgi:hypothetical protein